jgi:hypothetical protein
MSEEAQAASESVDSPPTETIDGPNYDNLDEIASLDGGSDESSPDEEPNTEGSDAEPKQDTENVPFDKHPRWIEREQEWNSKLGALESQLAALQSQSQQTAQQPKEKKPDYIDLGAMDDDGIVEMFDKSPKSFLGNFAKQVRAEVLKDITSNLSQKEATERARQEFESFAKDNPEFRKLVDSGEIDRVRQQYPYKSAFDAYRELTADSRREAREKEIQARIDKAVQEAVDKERKNISVKRQTKVLGSGPSPNKSGNQTPEELKDTKKFGGIKAVLKRRHMERSKVA